MKILTFKTCKKIHQLSLENPPETDMVWSDSEDYTLPKKLTLGDGDVYVPAYQVQDILSREFLEALGKKLSWIDNNANYCRCRITGEKAERNPVFLADCLCHREYAPDEWRQHGRLLLEAYWQSQEKFEEKLLKLIEKK